MLMHIQQQSIKVLPHIVNNSSIKHLQSFLEVRGYYNFFFSVLTLHHPVQIRSIVNHIICYPNMYKAIMSTLKLPLEGRGIKVFTVTFLNIPHLILRGNTERYCESLCLSWTNSLAHYLNSYRLRLSTRPLLTC